MTFRDALSIWQGLIGKRLHSIRSGAELTIEEIDFERGRLVVRGSSGAKSRPFTELQRVWDALVKEVIVHVDSILSGSGSSRNQPETLFANLPWIEWCEIRRKKHLVLTGESTHPAGTLAKASPERLAHAEEVQKRRKGGYAELVVPVTHVTEVASVLNRLTGQSPEAIAPGEYIYVLGKLPIRLVREDNESSSGVVVRTSLLPSGQKEVSLRLGRHVTLKPIED